MSSIVIIPTNVTALVNTSQALTPQSLTANTMSVFSLPHEGITLEFLARPIHLILLQPLLTAPLLALNIYKPEEVLKHIPIRLQEYLYNPQANVILSGLVVAGLLFQVNKFLTRMSLNNWTSDRSWKVSKEIVLVTGGNSGIGKQMVEQFARKGYKVASVDISEPKGSLPANVKFFKADVTSSEAIKAAATQIRQQLGEPTVIVNNAGVGHAKEILNESEAEIRLTIGVNLLSHFLMFREFAPYLIKNNHGHIVTIASMASFMCQASNVDYASTKAGVLAFHEGIGQELRHRYNAPAVRTT